MQVLLNHVGYAPAAAKRATVQASQALEPRAFSVIDLRTRAVVHTGVTRPVDPVPGWQGRHFAHADFDSLTTPGRYAVMLDGTWPPVQSQPFEIGDQLFGSQMLSDIVHYFKGQRCTGLFDDADRRAPLLDTREPRDVHGGWYDASGDCSKYLSHLSYANFMNPQQTPLVTWTLLAGRDRIPPQSKWLDERIVDEALHGADFLVRMQAPEGFFYTTVFDKWSKDEQQREICSYATQKGLKSADYQAGFRQGGGMAIAALARAAGAHRDGEFTREDYLDRAMLAFEVLAEHNADYLDDGVENLIDHYCALLAAAELFARTGDERWRDAGAARARAMLAQQDETGFWWCDEARTQQLFPRQRRRLAVPRADAIPRQRRRGRPRVRRRDPRRAREGPALRTDDHARRRQSARIPEAVCGDAGPRGRHAVLRAARQRDRLLVAGRERAPRFARERRPRGAVAATRRRRLRRPARRLRAVPRSTGCSAPTLTTPACCRAGARTRRATSPGFWNAPGGVCNGITSGLADEADIDFRKPEETEPMHSWRWTEQWIPHAAWLFCALAYGRPMPTKSFHPIDADRR